MWTFDSVKYYLNIVQNKLTSSVNRFKYYDNGGSKPSRFILSSI